MVFRARWWQLWPLLALFLASGSAVAECLYKFNASTFYSSWDSGVAQQYCDYVIPLSTMYSFEEYGTLYCATGSLPKYRWDCYKNGSHWYNNGTIGIVGSSCVPPEVWDNESQSCQVPLDCSGTQGQHTSAYTFGSTGPTCNAGCAYNYKSGTKQPDGTFWTLYVGTGQACDGQPDIAPDATPPEPPPNDNCFTTPSGQTFCQDNPNDDCYQMGESYICLGGNNDCGYVNGVFYCSENNTNCGFVNGSKVCVENQPDNGGDPDYCVSGSDGSIVCIGSHGQDNTQTSTSTAGDETTTTTTTSNNYGGPTTTTTTITNNVTGDQTTTTETVGDDPVAPAPGWGAGQAEGALGDTGLDAFAEGIGLDALGGWDGGDLPSFGWDLPGAGGACTGFSVTFRGETWLWDDYCAFWNSDVRPLLGWFFYMLTLIEIFRIWRASTGVE